MRLHHHVSAFALVIVLHSAAAFVAGPCLGRTGESRRTCCTAINNFRPARSVSGSTHVQSVPLYAGGKKKDKSKPDINSSDDPVDRKYGPADLTLVTFQKIKNDRAELEKFKTVLQERRKSLDYGEERENLALLNFAVENQLVSLLENKSVVERSKAKKRTYKPADFTMATSDEIAKDVEELKHFQSELEMHLATLSASKEKDNLILLNRFLTFRIAELRDLATSGEALQKAKSFVSTLMAAEIESISGTHGMRVLKNMYDLETGEQSNVVIRSITEPFWQACIEAVAPLDKNLRVCAVGTPGIGKTKTTTFLIRMLLQQGKTVVYNVREVDRVGWVYEFTPTMVSVADGLLCQDVKTKIFLEKDVNLKPTESLLDPSTFYIVDPGPTKTSCNPRYVVRARTIIVASPDSRHWGGNEFLKKRGTIQGTFKYYPLWSLKELLAARPFMANRVSEDLVRDRYRVSGGVPRNIFTDEASFLEFKDNTEAAVRKLTEKQANLLARQKYREVETKDPDQPASCLMGYVYRDPLFVSPAFEILSPFVEEVVFFEHMKTLWQTILSLGVEGGGAAAFEAYTRLLISRGVKLDYLPMWPTPTEEMTESGVYPSMNFDAAGHFHAFQTTLGDTHSFLIDELQKWEKAVGAENLSLYYLVPHTKFRNFKFDKSTLKVIKDAGLGCAIYKAMIVDPEKENRVRNVMGIGSA